MEFPDTGVQCSWKNCEQLDFLPFQCQHCDSTFCKQHFQPFTHDCPRYEDNVAENLKKGTYHICSDETCEKSSPMEMLCVKCEKHFCLVHRHHGCLDLSEEDKAKNLDKWNKPKEDFAAAKKVVDEGMKKKIKKSKNLALAKKVHLMKYKLRSIGLDSIPVEHACFFLVYYPKSQIKKENFTSICVSFQWSVGKTIDFISTYLGVPNRNNKITENKLRLFHHNNGLEISNKMDVLLAELLKNETLEDGEKLILEYSNESRIDNTLY